MSSVRIKNIVKQLRDRGDFALMEDCPEDLNEDRTEFDELKEIYERMYYALVEIESELENKS